jgi:hypothetical protein
MKAVRVRRAMLGVAGVMLLGAHLFLLRGKAAESSGDVTRQIDELVKHAEGIMDARIQQWEKRSAPFTVKSLRLYKQAMSEVVKEVLSKTLKSPLSEAKMRELKQGLEEFVAPPFNVTPNQDLTDNDVQEIEYLMEKTAELWDKEGRELTKIFWRNSLQTQMDVFLNYALTPERKAQIERQVNDLASLIEQEVMKWFPDLPRTQIEAISSWRKKQALADMAKAFSPHFKRPIPAEKWAAIGTQLSADKSVIEYVVRGTKARGATGRDVEFVYAVLWNRATGEMALPPSQTIQDFSDFNKRWKAYQQKLHDPQERFAQRYLATSFGVHQAFRDREVMVSLIQIALELSP